MTMSGKELTTGQLEFKDESTGRHDFWIGETHGKSVMIHFGKSGSPGHKGSREFKTTEAAREFLESRLQQKIEEGYQQVE